MIEKVIALLDNLDAGELQQLPPARLRRYADQLYRWHVLAETAAGGKPFAAVRHREQPKSGVLSKLRDGERSDRQPQGARRRLLPAPNSWRLGVMKLKAHPNVVCLAEHRRMREQQRRHDRRARQVRDVRAARRGDVRGLADATDRAYSSSPLLLRKDKLNLGILWI